MGVFPFRVFFARSGCFCPHGGHVYGRKTQAQANATKGLRDVLLNIPARRMWGWTGGVDGYCGETSIQSSLIYYGNYASQEQYGQLYRHVSGNYHLTRGTYLVLSGTFCRVRYADGNAELILSVNDAKAAKALKLQYEEWNYQSKQPQKKAFTTWLKKNLDAGYPVTAGFYLKQQGGDADFDHIMIIIGYSVDNSGNVNGIYHNDYYLDQVVYAPDVFATRNECTMKNPTQPYQYCLPTNVDYAYEKTLGFDFYVL